MPRQLELEAEQAGGSGSGLHARAHSGFALREGTLEHALTKNTVVLGRGSDVDVVASGPLVSRRHAELVETERGFVVTDLGSRNGVFVNGKLIAGATLLERGDSLTIGESTFVLVELVGESVRHEMWSDVEPREPTLESERVPAGTYGRDEVSVPTRRANALQLLGGVVDKELALGHGTEAEQVIGSHLVAALSDATAGRGVLPEVARSAAQYAVKLASATGKAGWLDFAFRLYRALGETIPLPIVNEMYIVLRRVHGLDQELLRNYTESLRRHGERLSAPERFVLQRLEGLERLAGWHSPS